MTAATNNDEREGENMDKHDGFKLKSKTRATFGTQAVNTGGRPARWRMESCYILHDGNTSWKPTSSSGGGISCGGGGGGGGGGLYSLMRVRCIHYYSMPSSAGLMGALGPVLSRWAGGGMEIRYRECESAGGHCKLTNSW